MAIARTAQPIPEDEEKAVVTENFQRTKTYVQDKPEGEDTKDQAKGDNKNASSGNQTPTFIRQNQTSNIPQNRLADMFDEIEDAQDYDGEIFYAMITRRQDMMNDAFARPCFNIEQFPALQIRADMLLNFIPMIQKHNGNSGGLFDVVITDDKGQSIDIGLAGLRIPNPILENKPQETVNSNNDLTQIINLMREENRANREMIQAALNPKRDRLTEILEKKFEQDILNPPEPKNNSIDVANIVQQMMLIPTVMGAMGEGFKGMFANGGNAPEREKGIVEMLLSNETLVNRASDILDNTLSNIADIAETAVANRNGVSRQQPVYTEPQPQPQPLQETNTVDQVEEPEETETQETEMDRKQLIIDIIKELESDNKLDDTNEFLLGLEEKHLDVYNMLITLCKNMEFENVVAQLGALVPEAFEGLTLKSDPVKLNKRGLHIQGRLREFYDYMKASK